MRTQFREEPAVRPLRLLKEDTKPSPLPYTTGNFPLQPLYKFQKFQKLAWKPDSNFRIFPFILRTMEGTIMDDESAETTIFDFGTPEVVIRPQRRTGCDGGADIATPGRSTAKKLRENMSFSTVGSPGSARRKPFHDVRHCAAQCVCVFARARCRRSCVRALRPR